MAMQAMPKLSLRIPAQVQTTSDIEPTICPRYPWRANNNISSVDVVDKSEHGRTIKAYQGGIAKPNVYASATTIPARFTLVNT